MIIIIFLQVFKFLVTVKSRTEVLLHFIVVSGLLKKTEAKKVSILEKCLVLSLHVFRIYPSMKGHTKRKKSTA